jgi:hypothetical protein
MASQTSATNQWGQKAVNQAVIQTLVAKTPKVLPGNVAWHGHYAFFARHEFTAAAASLVQKHSAHLVTLAQLEADMQRWLQIEASAPD